MKIGPLKINLVHLAAFALAVVGIFAKEIHDAVLAGTPISWAWLAASGIGGAVWLAFQETIWPDITGGGGTSKTMRTLLARRPPPTPVGMPVSPASFYAPKKSGFFDLRFAPIFLMLVAQTLYFGCAQIQAAFPQLDKIEQVVLADLTAGKTAVQIESDVAGLLAGKTGTEIVVIVNDVITVLIDAGVIPPGVIPQAVAVQTAERAKLTGGAK